MIQIIFNPGTFGSSIENIFRCFTSPTSFEKFELAKDGSTHLNRLPYHWRSKEELDDFFANQSQYKDQIISSIYPMHNYTTNEVINFFGRTEFADDKKIILVSKDIEDSELCLLFKYHKLIVGTIQKDKFLFLRDMDTTKYGYESIEQVPNWVKREWFSEFYPAYINSWTISTDIPENSLVVDYTKLLTDTEHTMMEIINHCDKTVVNSKGIKNCLNQWVLEQKYILYEFNQIETIVDAVLNDIPITWFPLSWVGESIVQSRLKRKGKNIRCWNLNTFPTSSRVLSSLLEDE